MVHEDWCVEISGISEEEHIDKDEDEDKDEDDEEDEDKDGGYHYSKLSRYFVWDEVAEFLGEDIRQRLNNSY